MHHPAEQEQQRIFTRRALILGGGKLALTAALIGRLYYLQVVQADRYRTLSEDNRFNLELVPAARGRILDRSGVPLADNRDEFRIEIVAEQAESIQATLTALRSVVFISDREIERVLREARRKRPFVPITVAENLTREAISRVAVNSPYLPGIRIEARRSRFYPHGHRAVHITGYVAAVSEAEQTGDPVLELPDFQIGKSGVEKRFDRPMRGIAGRRQVEVNALGRIVRRLPGVEGQPGEDVRLTLDMDLQRFAAARVARGHALAIPADHNRVHTLYASLDPVDRARLSDPSGTVYLGGEGQLVPPESGAAVVMDVHRGDILAMVSTPGFDPNKFTNGISARDWEDLLSNPRAPMINKSIGGQYSPGSTYKMVVALAAMEARVANPSSPVFCRGHLRLGRARFHCWKRQGHGVMRMRDALEQSCDIYFYEMGKRLGIDRLSAMARRFGLGTLLDVGLDGARPGLIPTKAWKKAERGESWHAGETLVCAIGQGFVQTTPLQLALMTARLVNGGVAVQPRLVIGEEQPSPPSLNFRRSHLRAIGKGMAAVVNGRRGTALALRETDPQRRFGGKTGTVQVKRITRKERLAGIVKNEDRPWRDRDHSLFVGYAPLDAPRYAVAVVIEHGGSGSKMAAPIARDILAEAIRLDPLGDGASAGLRPGRRGRLG